MGALDAGAAFFVDGFRELLLLREEHLQVLDLLLKRGLGLRDRFLKLLVRFVAAAPQITEHHVLIPRIFAGGLLEFGEEFETPADLEIRGAIHSRS